MYNYKNLRMGVIGSKLNYFDRKLVASVPAVPRVLNTRISTFVYNPITIFLRNDF